MKIYHTAASSPDLKTARSMAPSFDQGYGWLPYRMSLFDEPYFLDNGAFTGQFDSLEFIGALERTLQKMPREPDFVVLPDIYQDAGPSIARSAKWAGAVAMYDLPYYLPVQDGAPVEMAVRAAVELDAAGIFVGGSNAFKKEFAGQFVMTAHDYGLKCHIGKPGKRLTWARDIGADSVDTSSIVRNGYWDRLRKLEGATPTTEAKLTEVVADAE